MEMFFNNDSIVVVSAILVLGVFTYTYYNNIFTTVHNTSNTIVYKEVGVQTESLVNTELPESTCIQPNVLPDKIYVDAEVQTKSLWELFNEWLNEFHSTNGSESVSTSSNSKVESWLNNLDHPSQNIPSHTNTQEIAKVSDLPSHTNIQEISTVSDLPSHTNIQEMVEVSDMIYENSESNVQGLVHCYDIMDEYSYGQAISQPNAIFDHIEVNSIHQYYIYISDIILSVNPDLINCFI